MLVQALVTLSEGMPAGTVVEPFPSCWQCSWVALQLPGPPPYSFKFRLKAPHGGCEAHKHLASGA